MNDKEKVQSVPLKRNFSFILPVHMENSKRDSSKQRREHKMGNFLFYTLIVLASLAVNVLFMRIVISVYKVDRIEDNAYESMIYEDHHLNQNDAKMVKWDTFNGRKDESEGTPRTVDDKNGYEMDKLIQKKIIDFDSGITQMHNAKHKEKSYYIPYVTSPYNGEDYSDYGDEQEGEEFHLDPKVVHKILNGMPGAHYIMNGENNIRYIIKKGALGDVQDFNRYGEEPRIFQMKQHDSGVKYMLNGKEREINFYNGDVTEPDDGDEYESEQEGLDKGLHLHHKMVQKILSDRQGASYIINGNNGIQYRIMKGSNDEDEAGVFVTNRRNNNFRNVFFNKYGAKRFQMNYDGHFNPKLINNGEHVIMDEANSQNKDNGMEDTKKNISDEYKYVNLNSEDK